MTVFLLIAFLWLVTTLWYRKAAVPPHSGLPGLKPGLDPDASQFPRFFREATQQQYKCLILQCLAVAMDLVVAVS